MIETQDLLILKDVCINTFIVIGKTLGYEPAHMNAVLTWVLRRSQVSHEAMIDAFPNYKPEYERCLALLESVHNEHSSPTKGEPS